MRISVLMRPVRPGQRSLHVRSVSPCPPCSRLSWQVLGTLPKGCADPPQPHTFRTSPLGFDVLLRGQAVHAERVADIGNPRLGDVARRFLLSDDRAALHHRESDERVATAAFAALLHKVTKKLVPFWRPGSWVWLPRQARSLGYELTGRNLQSPRGSQTHRSRDVARPNHRTALHTISAVAPRFVHKSVTCCTAASICFIAGSVDFSERGREALPVRGRPGWRLVDTPCSAGRASQLFLAHKPLARSPTRCHNRRRAGYGCARERPPRSGTTSCKPSSTPCGCRIRRRLIGFSGDVDEQ